MKPFGGGHVVVRDGRVVDDGDFSTANNDPVILRAYAIWHADGTLVAGRVPPSRSAKKDGRLPWLLTRPELAALNFNEFPAAKYRIQLWGGVDTNPDWYEIGSSNPADNGATDVEISTWFTVGPAQPTAIEILRRGVERLERSDAYKRNFTNVVAGTKDCRRALDQLS